MAVANPPRRPPPPLLDDACALFLDVDGTLLEFAVRPDLVRLPLGALETLGRISDRLGGALALVSGRPLSELDHLFSPMRLPAAGLHGQEFRGAASCTLPRSGDALAALRHEAAQLAERHPGVWIEDKGANLALHWRAAPQFAPQVQAFADTHLFSLTGYRLQPGDHVLELVPADVDKGRAVHTLLAEAPFHGRTPVFVGDDLTDEFGFAAANAAGGWSVLVGDRATSHAHYQLSNPVAVHAWLRNQLVPLHSMETA
jgi:trehalose 6-phosphatase (EC 3.1.3.12)